MLARSLACLFVCFVKEVVVVSDQGKTVTNQLVFVSLVKKKKGRRKKPAAQKVVKNGVKATLAILGVCFSKTRKVKEEAKRRHDAGWMWYANSNEVADDPNPTTQCHHSACA